MNSAEARYIEKVAKELHELNNKLDRIHKDVMDELKVRRPSTLNEEREKMGFEPKSPRQIIDEAMANKYGNKEEQ